MGAPENDTSVLLASTFLFRIAHYILYNFPLFPGAAAVAAAAVLASFRAPCLCGDWQCAIHTHMHRQLAARQLARVATASDAANCARHPSV